LSFCEDALVAELAFFRYEHLLAVIKIGLVEPAR